MEALSAWDSDPGNALIAKSPMLSGAYRWIGEPYTLFIKCRRVAFHDNPAKQSVSLCNKPTHDKGIKFLHYCG